jgi:hypothetical protein
MVLPNIYVSSDLLKEIPIKHNQLSSSKLKSYHISLLAGYFNFHSNNLMYLFSEKGLESPDRELQCNQSTST